MSDDIDLSQIPPQQPANPAERLRGEVEHWQRRALAAEQRLKEKNSMRITTITVRYGRTKSLYEYSNVRPEVTLVAEIDPGDDLDHVTARLLNQAKAIVEEEVDLALERDGQPALFSTDPRYQIWRVIKRHSWRGNFTPPEELILIVPAEIPMDPHPSGCNWPLADHKPQRIGPARDTAVRMLRSGSVDKATVRLIDCSDGDLSRIPAWVFLPIPDTETEEEA
jgi:hypothetical protein